MSTEQSSYTDPLAEEQKNLSAGTVEENAQKQEADRTTVLSSLQRGVPHLAVLATAFLGTPIVGEYTNTLTSGVCGH